MRLWYVHSHGCSDDHDRCRNDDDSSRNNYDSRGDDDNGVIRITEVNTRCATSDVNPFKIRCNLQITKATVSETQ